MEERSATEGTNSNLSYYWVQCGSALLLSRLWSLQTDSVRSYHCVPLLSSHYHGPLVQPLLSPTAALSCVLNKTQADLYQEFTKLCIILFLSQLRIFSENNDNLSSDRESDTTTVVRTDKGRARLQHSRLGYYGRQSQVRYRCTFCNIQGELNILS